LERANTALAGSRLGAFGADGVLLIDPHGQLAVLGTNTMGTVVVAAFIARV
jgi:hypothetical protein